MMNELKDSMDNELLTDDTVQYSPPTQSKGLLTKSRFIGFYQAGSR